MLCCLLTPGICLLWLPVLALLLPLIIYVRFKKLSVRNAVSQDAGLVVDNNNVMTCAFFHPYCHAGGGGERVLWTAIRALQNKYPNLACVVYSGDTNATAEEIVKKVHSVFGIILPRKIKFVFLSGRFLVESRLYPRFTLFGQSFGSVLLGIEALIRFPPDIYIDSMGYAFTLPIFRYLIGAKTAAYVHYPTISTDMVEVVESRKVVFNNEKFISNSSLLTQLKLRYYRLFSYLYGCAGRCSHLVMVNSSWTLGHINAIWNISGKTFVVYPPCNTNALKQLPTQSPAKSREPWIVSVGQFRPEKNHSLQLEAFRLFLNNCKSPNHQLVGIQSDLRLILIGGCRDAGDVARVEALKLEAESLDIGDRVDILVNAGYDKLIEMYSKATIGVHTMLNEHFGIGVVECMAAGLIIVANNSGGPRMDIVTSKSGVLASTVEEYADAFQTIFSHSIATREAMIDEAVRRTAQFSDEAFSEEFLRCTHQLLSQQQCCSSER